MEAPGRLSDKEDSMPSLSLRNVATAAVLTLALGLAAAPATAQPSGPRETPRIESGFLARAWQWLTGTWGVPFEQGQERALATSGSGSDSLTPAVLRRGGTMDPNG
jgi:hypothetical protein